MFPFALSAVGHGQCGQSVGLKLSSRQAVRQALSQCKVAAGRPRLRRVVLARRSIPAIGGQTRTGCHHRYTLCLSRWPFPSRLLLKNGRTGLGHKQQSTPVGKLTWFHPLVSWPGQQQPCDPRLDNAYVSPRHLDIGPTRLLPGARQGFGRGGRKKGCVARWEHRRAGTLIEMTPPISSSSDAPAAVGTYLLLSSSSCSSSYLRAVCTRPGWASTRDARGSCAPTKNLWTVCHPRAKLYGVRIIPTGHSWST